MYVIGVFPPLRDDFEKHLELTKKRKYYPCLLTKDAVIYQIDIEPSDILIYKVSGYIKFFKEGMFADLIKSKK